MAFRKTQSGRHSVTTNKIEHFATVKQPMSIAHDGLTVLASIQETGLCRNLEIALNARDAIGQETYGTSLQPDNGRDPMVDAYQESLDLVMYLRQSELEGKPRARALLERAVALAESIQSEIEQLDYPDA